MKLSDIFVTKQIQDDFVMVSTKNTTFNGIVNANKSAGFIIECLKVDTTREEIIEKMLEKYDAPKDVIAEDVDKVIEALKGIGAINE